MIYRQVENSFTQPNAAMNIQMLEWALGATKDSTGDLLELYCGNGNFSWRLHVILTAFWPRNRQAFGLRPRNTISQRIISITCKSFVCRQKSLPRHERCA
jgi:hypothetical protein